MKLIFIFKKQYLTLLAFYLTCSLLGTSSIWAQYTASPAYPTYTYSDNSSWGSGILKMRCQISGNSGSFTVQKQDNGRFTSSGTMYLGVYDNGEFFYVDSRSVRAYRSSTITLSDNFTEWASSDFPVDYYAYYVSNDGGWATVGPIRVDQSNQTPPPSTPNLYAVNATASNSISIRWSRIWNATNYRLYRSTSYWGNYQQIYWSSGTSYTDSGNHLNPNTTYYYKVKAENSGGQSAYSGVRYATTYGSAPTTPNLYAVTATASNSVSISWSRVSNATNYRLYRATSYWGNYQQIYWSSGTNYTDSGSHLSPNTTYYYKVQAENNSGQSAYSNVRSTTTHLGTPTVTLTYPNYGGSFTVGSRVNIAWQSTNQQHYGLYLYKGGTASYQQVGTINLTSASTAKNYSWIIPERIQHENGTWHTINGDNYKIKVVVWNSNNSNVAAARGDYSSSYFSIRPPNPVVRTNRTSYNRGENIIVSWQNYPSTTRQVKISLKRDSYTGNTPNADYVVLTNSTTNNGQRTFVIPQTVNPASDWRVWVKDVYNGNIIAHSYPIQINLARPTVRLISPNSGSFTVGNQLNIAWQSINQQHYGLYLYKGGTSENHQVGTIHLTNTSSATNYNWTIPERIQQDNGTWHTIDGNNYRIKIVVWNSNDPNIATAVGDYSNSYLTIRPPNLLVRTNRSTYNRGENMVVYWQNYPSSTRQVKISLKRDSYTGSTPNADYVVLTNNTINNGQRTFTISQTVNPASDWRVWVKDIQNGHIVAHSSPIRINLPNPTVTLTNPNSGTFTVGEPVPIYWTSTHQQHYGLYLYKGGTNENHQVGTIHLTSTSSDQNYNWIVPEQIQQDNGAWHTINGNDYKIKVVVWNSNDPDIAVTDYDFSNGNLVMSTNPLMVTGQVDPTMGNEGDTFTWTATVTGGNQQQAISTSLYLTNPVNQQTQEYVMAYIQNTNPPQFTYSRVLTDGGVYASRYKATQGGEIVYATTQQEPTVRQGYHEPTAFIPYNGEEGIRLTYPDFSWDNNNPNAPISEVLFTLKKMDGFNGQAVQTLFSNEQVGTNNEDNQFTYNGDLEADTWYRFWIELRFSDGATPVGNGAYFKTQGLGIGGGTDECCVAITPITPTDQETNVSRKNICFQWDNNNEGRIAEHYHFELYEVEQGFLYGYNQGDKIVDEIVPICSNNEEEDNLCSVHGESYFITETLEPNRWYRYNVKTVFVNGEETPIEPVYFETGTTINPDLNLTITNLSNSNNGNRVYDYGDEMKIEWEGLSCLNRSIKLVMTRGHEATPGTNDYYLIRENYTGETNTITVTIPGGLTQNNDWKLWLKDEQNFMQHIPNNDYNPFLTCITNIEINNPYEGVVISRDDMIISCAGEHHLGAALHEDRSVRFMMYNYSNEPIEISDFMLDLNYDNEYEISEQPSDMIPPNGGCTSFVLTFRYQDIFSAGGRLAEVKFNINDSPCSFTIRGHVLDQEQYCEYFEEAAGHYDIPSNLLRAIAHVESNWLQDSSKVINGVREWGMMQIKETKMEALAEGLRNGWTDAGGNTQVNWYDYHNLSDVAIITLLKSPTLDGVKANIRAGALLLRQYAATELRVYESETVTATERALWSNNAEEYLEAWWFTIAQYDADVDFLTRESNYPFRIYNALLTGIDADGEPLPENEDGLDHMITSSVYFNCPAPDIRVAKIPITLPPHITYRKTTDRVWVADSNLIPSTPKFAYHLEEESISCSNNMHQEEVLDVSFIRRTEYFKCGHMTYFHLNSGEEIDLRDCNGIDEQVVADFELVFPLADQTPYNAPINSVFDYCQGGDAINTSIYPEDDYVQAYTGEIGYRSENGVCGGGQCVYGFRNGTGQNFIVNGNYTGAGDPSRLWYDGHPAYDYRSVSGSRQYATAAGTFHIVSDCAGAYIDHGNGYRTYYLHCSGYNQVNEANVDAGDLIGWTGDRCTGAAHAHIEIRKSDLNNVPVRCDGSRCHVVDPYGWHDDSPDEAWTRAEFSTLWSDGMVNEQGEVVEAAGSMLAHATIWKQAPNSEWEKVGYTNEQGILYLVHTNYQPLQAGTALKITAPNYEPLDFVLTERMLAENRLQVPMLPTVQQTTSIMYPCVHVLSGIPVTSQPNIPLKITAQNIDGFAINGTMYNPVDSLPTHTLVDTGFQLIQVQFFGESGDTVTIEKGITYYPSDEIEAQTFDLDIQTDETGIGAKLYVNRTFIQQITANQTTVKLLKGFNRLSFIKKGCIAQDFILYRDTSGISFQLQPRAVYTIADSLYLAEQEENVQHGLGMTAQKTGSTNAPIAIKRYVHDHNDLGIIPQSETFCFYNHEQATDVNLRAAVVLDQIQSLSIDSCYLLQIDDQAQYTKDSIAYSYHPISQKLSLPNIYPNQEVAYVLAQRQAALATANTLYPIGAGDTLCLAITDLFIDPDAIPHDIKLEVTTPPSSGAISLNIMADSVKIIADCSFADTSSCTLTAQHDGLVTSRNVVVYASGANQTEITVSISNDTTICKGDTAPLTASGGTTYQWMPANSLNESTIANPIASPTITTSYQVTITDNNGCSAERSVTVTVEDLPDFTITETPATCGQANGALTINITNPNDYTYTWSDGQTTATANQLVAGTYSVTVTHAQTACSEVDMAVVSGNTTNNSDVPTIAWDRTFGGSDHDYIVVVKSALNGGSILGGYSLSNAGEDKSENSRGDYDYWIILVDTSGNKIWDKTFGGGLSDKLSSILVLSDGYLLGGYSGSNISGDKSENSRGSFDYWVIKVDENGNKLWDKTYGGGSGDLLRDMEITSNGYMLAGYSNSNVGGDKSENSRGGYDYWVIKVDENGNKLWDKTYGGERDEMFFDLLSIDNGYLLGGESYSDMGGDKSENSRGEADCWIVKLDENGSKLWDKTYGGEGNDECRTLISANNSYLVGGPSESSMSGEISENSRGLNDYWLIKIDMNGDKLWDKLYGSSGHDYLQKIVHASNERIFLAGVSSGDSGGDKSEDKQGWTDYWLLEVDSNGQLIWENTIGGQEEDSLFDADFEDNKVVLVGHSNSPVSGDKSESSLHDYDFWIVALDLPTSTDLTLTLTPDTTICTGDSIPLSASGGQYYSWEPADGLSDPNIADPVASPTETTTYTVTASTDEGCTATATVTIMVETLPDFTIAETPATCGQANGFLTVNITNPNDYTYTWSDGQTTATANQLVAGTYSVTVTHAQTACSEVDMAVVSGNTTNNSDVPTIAWDKTFGGDGKDDLYVIERTLDGGTILGGISTSNAGDYKSENSRGYEDYWIVKIDGDGNYMWDKTFGGNKYDRLRSIVVLPDGYLVGGHSESNISGDKSEVSRGAYDIWIIRLDINGNKLWDRTYGGNGWENLADIVQTNSGYLLGSFSVSSEGGEKSENSRGANDYWIIKIDEEGDKLWDKTYGGALSEWLSDILPINGGYLLGGRSNSNISSEKSEDSRGTHDYWVVKIDSDGNKLWDKTYGGSNVDDCIKLMSVNNEYYLGGYSFSNISGEKSENSRVSCDYWLIKIDQDGAVLWDKTYGSNSFDAFHQMSYTTDGRIFLGGRSIGESTGEKSENSRGVNDYWLLEIDESGELIWDKTIGGSNQDYLYDMTFSNNQLLLAGYSNSPISGEKSEANLGGDDFWIVALDLPTSTDLTLTLTPDTIICTGDSIPLSASGGQYYSWEPADGLSHPNIADPIASPTETTTYTVTASTDEGCTATATVTITVETLPDFTIDATSPSCGLANGSLAVNINQPTDYSYAWSNGANSQQINDLEAGEYTVTVTHSASNCQDVETITLSSETSTDVGPNIVWDKTLGGSGYDGINVITSTLDGGYILGGYSMSNIGDDKSEDSRGGSDYWIVLMDENGNKIWDKTFGGSWEDKLHDILVLSDGYLLAGESESNIGGDKSENSRGDIDYWLIKIDQNGNKLWDKTYGGDKDDVLHNIEMVDDGYVLGGYSESDISGEKSENSRGSYDYWLIHLNRDGHILWDKTVGGNQTDQLWGIAVEEDGFILGGVSSSPIGGEKSENGQGSDDYWLVKLDRNGTELWDKVYGGSDFDNLTALLSTSNGYLLGGYSISNTSGDKSENNRGLHDYWVISVDKEGNLLWDKTYGSDHFDFLLNIVETPDGGFAFIGNSKGDVSGEKSEPDHNSSDGWVVKTDSVGQIIWDKTLGSTANDGFYSGIVSSNNQIVVAGFSLGGISGEKSEANLGGSDYWLVSLEEGCDPNSSKQDLRAIPNPQTLTLKVYPNPTNDQLHLSCTSPKEQAFNLQVYDVQGKQWGDNRTVTLQQGQNQITLDVRTYPSGVYLVYMQNGAEKVSQKFVKE